MPRGNILLNQLNGGEVSPRLDTRSDLEKYRSACRVLENMIPFVEGGATKCPGTYFVIETKDSSKKSRIVKFHFSTIQAYALEVGDKYIRFYKKDGQIVTTYSAWVTATDYYPGKLVTNAGSYYRCLIYHTSGVFATDLAAGKWVITAGATDTTYEIPTPYLEADLFDLDMSTQTADVLFIFHESYPPAKLERHDHDDWRLVELHCVASADKAITGITQANPGVVTCTGHGFETGDQVYIQSVAGMVEVNAATFTITAIDANSFSIGVNTTTYTPYTSAGTATNRLFFAEGKYPSCGCLYEQRLVLAGADDTPTQIDLSASAEHENFIQDPDDDSAAISHTLDSKKVDRIRWMIGQEILVIGTSGGVWRFGSSNITEPVTATNVMAKKQVPYGVARIQPEMVGDSILWVTRSGRTVRNFLYSLETDKWKAPDVTRIANHIMKGTTNALSGIVDMNYQEEPIPILWTVRRDGQLPGLVCEIDENVYAWWRRVSDGFFESVAVTSQENDEDQVWLIVRREIDGDTKRYIEYFKPHEFFSQLRDCFFVDCGLTWNGGDAVDITGITNANPAVVSATSHGFEDGDEVRIKDVVGMTEINVGLTQAYTVANKTAHTFELSGIDSTGWAAYTSGGTAQKVRNSFNDLGHLEGKEVSFLIDGAVHPNVTVDSATVLLSWYGNLIHVGLPYTSIAEPMKLHVGQSEGASKGRKQKISELTLSFYETAYAKYGPDAEKMQEIPFGSGGSLELFSGDKSNLEFPGDWGDEATIRIESDLPLPMTILAIVPKINLSND